MRLPNPNRDDEPEKAKKDNKDPEIQPPLLMPAHAQPEPFPSQAVGPMDEDLKPFRLPDPMAPKEQEALPGVNAVGNPLVLAYTQDQPTLGIMDEASIPLETQTLYGEALERARLMELDRSFGHLSGSFGKKQVGDGAFWYFRTSEGAQGRREFYVGPDSAEIHSLIDRYQAEHEQRQVGRESLDRMGAMLAHGGCMTMDTPSARVVEAIAAGGVFRLGGVLVGTHAFVAMGNMLGVRWRTGTRTQDLDFAAFRTMEVAAPQDSADLWKALDALNMGFLPTPGLDPRVPSTSYFVRGKELRVDFLTTGSHRGENGPVFLPRFNAAASPVRFMNYLLKETTDAIALGRSSATLVRVPQPARFGFHKILVAEERPSSSAVKATKDISQAKELLEFMLGSHPSEVSMAFESLIEEGLAIRVWKTAQRRMKDSPKILDFIQSMAPPS